MVDVHDRCHATAEEYGRPGDYVAGANIAGYARVAEAREREQQAMLGYLRTAECRMRYLREQLDDPEATDCGRCDNCGGLTLSTSVSEAAVAEAGQRRGAPMPGTGVVGPEQGCPIEEVSLDAIVQASHRPSQCVEALGESTDDRAHARRCEVGDRPKDVHRDPRVRRRSDFR